MQAEFPTVGTIKSANQAFPFVGLPRGRPDLGGFDGIKDFKAASPAGVMQYVQPKEASHLRCSQPFSNIAKIVDGPAGYSFVAGNQSFSTKACNALRSR